MKAEILWVSRDTCFRSNERPLPSLGKAPNQKFTMARKRSESNGTNGINHIQYPPERIIRLLVGIRSTISLAEGRAVSYEDLEKLSGRAAGTISSWFEGARMNQVEFLFALLERVPQRLRYELLETTCRTQPTLQHPRLAHDPIVVSQLEAMLKRSAGFSLINGGPDHARAFLLHALGNSTREVNAGRQFTIGAELHDVLTWAPVPGVSALLPHGEVRQQFQRLWSKIKQASDGSLVLLGGVWNRVSHLHSEMVQLAGRCHVVVADEFPKPDELTRRIPRPVCTLTVTPAREQPEWIRVAVVCG